MVVITHTVNKDRAFPVRMTRDTYAYGMILLCKLTWTEWRIRKRIRL